MNEEIVAPKAPETQAKPLSATYLAKQQSHRYHAAFHLYNSVKPEGGLEYPELSPAQRKFYEGLIDQARAETRKGTA